MHVLVNCLTPSPLGMNKIAVLEAEQCNKKELYANASMTMEAMELILLKQVWLLECPIIKI